MGKILQLKICLKDIAPEIWRKFLVDDSITFEQLHEIIQIVMGWDDYHLYEFSVGDEKITEKDSSVKYPFCIEGERACSPEDCGSVSGYYHLMEIKENKDHPDHQEKIVEWLGEKYDPELFDKESVNALLHGEIPASDSIHEENEFVPPWEPSYSR